MKFGIGQSSRLERPQDATDGWATYPSEVFPNSRTRAAVWVVEFPSLSALCEWAKQYYAVSVRPAHFDDDTPTWMLVVCEEPEYSK